MRRLLIRPGAIGDVILSLPELEAHKADYTEIWAPRPLLPLLRFADRTRAIIDTGLELVGVRDEAQVPELAMFDEIYSWYGTNRPEFRAAVAHLPFRFFDPHVHPPGIPRIEIPAAPVENVAVIHPFSGSLRKNWPLEQFEQVAERIGIPVEFCVGPEQVVILEPAIREADLFQLACRLSRARIFIGNDSGISHLAAAVGVPVVAIFRVTDPEIWRPRGSDVAVLIEPGVEDVLAAVRSKIRAKL